jgi:Galactose oxidase, central domain
MQYTPALCLLPCLAALASAQLPAPSLIQRVAPRAAWSVVAGAGLSTGATTGTPTVNATFRADNPGAASNDTLWVFGGSLGNNTATTTNDLWAFNAPAGTFTQVIADGAPGSPAARGRASIAWNPLTNKLVVFGGNTRGATPTLLNDLWEYDPITNAWANVTPAGASPAPRQHAPMTWDPNLNGMVLFGGQVNDTTPQVLSNETWALIGGTWVQLFPATVPAARTQHSMVTRQAPFSDVVMCLGLDSASAAPDQIRFLDVWRWNGSDWSLLSNCDVLTNPTGTGTTWPASTIGNQAVYDPLRKRIVVQGGNGITVAANVSYIYGPSYGGSPTNYTSEYDCLTNSWSIYANPTTGTTPFNNTDATIGRVSRYYAGFIPATGMVYKACGQDPTKSGSRPTNNVYAYQANPIATATNYGAGCVGGGAPATLTLTADDRPWTSRTFAATATGFGPLSLGLGVIGINTTSLPLIAVLPQGGLGCDLLATPDLVVTLVPTAGSAQIQLPIGNVPSLAGSVLHFQAAELALDLSFNVTGLFSSNGVTINVGAL